MEEDYLSNFFLSVMGLVPVIKCFLILLFGQDVLHRHPLYLIVRMLCYDDGLGAGKNLLALKTTDTKQEECSIWVYQCSSSVFKFTNNILIHPVCDHQHLLLNTTLSLSFCVSKTGAGSVHLQGDVSFFSLRSDIRQVLRTGGSDGSRGGGK